MYTQGWGQVIMSSRRTADHNNEEVKEEVKEVGNQENSDEDNEGDNEGDSEEEDEICSRVHGTLVCTRACVHVVYVYTCA